MRRFFITTILSSMIAVSISTTAVANELVVSIIATWLGIKVLDSAFSSEEEEKVVEFENGRKGIIINDQIHFFYNNQQTKLSQSQQFYVKCLPGYYYYGNNNGRGEPICE